MMYTTPAILRKKISKTLRMKKANKSKRKYQMIILRKIIRGKKNPDSLRPSYSLA